jgi:hypothetical protein
MNQRTLAMMTGFERYTKKTRRAVFLEEMEQVVPWRELCALIEPRYPKAGNGRPPIGVERMLRIYFLQQWFNLSDPAVEEALYDSLVMRQFVGIDLGREPVPDETTMCKLARVRGHEAEIRVREGALPRTPEECQSPVRHLRPGELVRSSQATTAFGDGVSQYPPPLSR